MSWNQSISVKKKEYKRRKQGRWRSKPGPLCTNLFLSPIFCYLPSPWQLNCNSWPQQCPYINPSTFTLTTIPQFPSHPPFYPNQSRKWWIRQSTTASMATRKSNSTVEVGFFIPMFSLITTTLFHPSAHWFMSHHMWHQSCLPRSHNLDQGCWI